MAGRRTPGGQWGGQVGQRPELDWQRTNHGTYLEAVGSRRAEVQFPGQSLAGGTKTSVVRPAGGPVTALFAVGAKASLITKEGLAGIRYVCWLWRRQHTRGTTPLVAPQSRWTLSIPFARSCRFGSSIDHNLDWVLHLPVSHFKALVACHS